MGSAGRLMMERLRERGQLHRTGNGGKEFHLELRGEVLTIRGRGTLEESHTDETNWFLPRWEYCYCLEGEQVEALLEALKEDFGTQRQEEHILLEEFEFTYDFHPLWQYLEQRGIGFTRSMDRLPY